MRRPPDPPELLSNVVYESFFSCEVFLASNGMAAFVTDMLSRCAGWLHLFINPAPEAGFKLSLKRKKEPQGWVQELISGDIPNLITGILTALISTLSVPLAITIPACALVTKSGVHAYCRQGKPLKKPTKPLKSMLMKKQPIKGCIVRGKPRR